MRPGPLAAVALLVAAAACDGGLQPVPVCGRGFVGMCGTARYAGTPPGVSDSVLLVAFPTYPQSCADVLTPPPRFRPFPPFVLQRPYVDSADYGLEVPADRYEWVVAVWKDSGAFTFTIADTAIVRVAGYYRNPADTSQRGIVTVPSGGAVSDVDVLVDFNNLRPVSSFFPCSAQ